MLILDEYFRWHLDAFASALFISSFYFEIDFEVKCHLDKFEWDSTIHLHLSEMSSV